jgi:putative FmdB family regulatory protein
VPIYKYACPRCGAEAEEMRPMDDANRDRPICHNGDVPMVMDLVIAPVPGIVRNPAAGPRRSKS